MRKIIRKYKITLFIILNLAVTFILRVILNTDYIPQWMPGLSALLLSGCTLGRSGVSMILARLKVRKQDIKWYLPATLIPLASCLIVYPVIYFMGDASSYSAIAPDYSGKEIIIAVVFIVLGSIGEETGWRGYMLPELMKKHSFLKSNMIIGIVWGVWHFMLNGGFSVFCIYTVYSIETSVLIAWLCRKTGNNIVVAILYHTTINIGGWLLFQDLFVTENYHAQFLLFSFQAIIILFPCLYIIRKQ